MESCWSAPATPPSRSIVHNQPTKPYSQSRVEKMRMRAEGLPGSSEVQRSIQQHLFGRGGQRGGGGHQSDDPVTPQLRKPRLSHTGDQRRDTSRTPQTRSETQYLPKPGDMKIQLNATTMAWVDPKGTILHQWKRTKRGTRGGRNRRTDLPASPQSTSSIARTSINPGMRQEHDSELSAGIAGAQQAQAEAHPVESSQQDSDCSSVSECHARQAAAVLQMTEHDSQADGTQMLEMSAEDGESVNLNTLTTSDLSELVSRLYGLVNSLQNENEQLASACAEVKFESQSAATEVSQLRQKLQQITAERDLLQQQVLFQHDTDHTVSR